ncbi:precorrin-3B synthase [Pseudomonas sp. RIT-PI-AD]|uniref:precorrin-3B synthase n=1 Tax=Pseudomonas sp. RIT-PI-AD TaxID=3035294 RepID=UPI0021DB0FFD|nr:precorrin-3B synthase [Pseudomonas sp. RIT-PI-AD]
MNEQTPTARRFPAPRPSACPGLLRIVPARDGGICRVRLAGGRLPAPQARALAEAALACASGTLELTNRANLQIRGVRAEHADELIARLLDAGLGPRVAGADDVRNLLLSPAAGLDPTACLDVRPLAERLLACVQAHPRFHGLSPKFALSLDGGEGMAMLEHPHDIWFAAIPGHDDQPLLAFGLAGCVPVSAEAPAALAALPVTEAETLLVALLDLFLERADAQRTRMRHVLEDWSPDALLEALRARLPFPLMRGGWLNAWRRVPAAVDAHIGVRPQRQPGLHTVGGVADLGRLRAECLLGLADLAEALGDGSLHLTPWQSLLLPNVPEARALGVLQTMTGLGLACAKGEPATRLIACSGSVDCARGLADSKADARRLAQLWPAGRPLPGVHLSACPRACAAAHVAPFTLLAVAAGRYDLFRRVAGQPGFGQALARSLSIEEAALGLAESTESPR